MKEISLTRGLVAFVDDEDYEWLTAFKWCAQKLPCGYYAKRAFRSNGHQFTVFMHRAVAGTPSGLWTDHVNGDKLDNRRCNLRIATPAQNMYNTPPHSSCGYRGVSFHAHTGKWRARLCVQGTTTSLGLFVSAEAAAEAFDVAAMRLYGEFAWLNFPDRILAAYRRDGELVPGAEIVHESKVQIV